jgi:hypothetical protein
VRLQAASARAVGTPNGLDHRLFPRGKRAVQLFRTETAERKLVPRVKPEYQAG